MQNRLFLETDGLGALAHRLLLDLHSVERSVHIMVSMMAIQAVGSRTLNIALILVVVGGGSSQMRLTSWNSPLLSVLKMTVAVRAALRLTRVQLGILNISTG